MPTIVTHSLQVPRLRRGSPAAAKLRIAAVWTALLAVAGVGLVWSAPHRASSTGRPVTQVQTLSCEKPADLPGKSVTTALITFPPRAYTAAHRHPGSVTAFVVSGSVRSQMAGTPAQIYHTGMTWFEPTGALHSFAENPSTYETAQLFAVFIADHDCGPLVIPEPEAHAP